MKFFQKLFIDQTSYAAPQLCCISLLVEESLAGKIVGPRAVTIQGIRDKAGATQIRMQKQRLVNDELSLLTSFSPQYTRMFQDASSGH